MCVCVCVTHRQRGTIKRTDVKSDTAVQLVGKNLVLINGLPRLRGPIQPTGRPRESTSSSGTSKRVHVSGQVIKDSKYCLVRQFLSNLPFAVEGITVANDDEKSFVDNNSLRKERL